MRDTIFAVLGAAVGCSVLAVTSAPILSGVDTRTRRLRRILLCAAVSLCCQKSDFHAGGNRSRAPTVGLSLTRPVESDHAETPSSSALVEDGDAVFFVGNSFLEHVDRPLPEWVAALGRAVSPPIRIVVGADIVPGNEPLAYPTGR